MAYEVFISFKRGRPDGSGLTRDYELAKDLHRTLTNKGVQVFFNERDLSTSSYVREIYRALALAVCCFLPTFGVLDDLNRVIYYLVNYYPQLKHSLSQLR